MEELNSDIVTPDLSTSKEEMALICQDKSAPLIDQDNSGVASDAFPLFNLGNFFEKNFLSFSAYLQNCQNDDKMHTDITEKIKQIQLSLRAAGQEFFLFLWKMKACRRDIYSGLQKHMYIF